MKFFNKDLCKKLEKLGCKSDQSGIWCDDCEKFYCCQHIQYDFNYESKFTSYDFLSSEPYAKENCKKLFPGRTILQDGGGYFSDTETYKFMRHKLLDAEDQEKFIEEHVARTNISG